MKDVLVITTKEERHEIYIKALHILKSKVTKPFSMCNSIWRVLAYDDSDYSIIRHEFNRKFLHHDTFPELEELRPANYKDNYKELKIAYWWDESDKEIRIKKFEILIEQTKCVQ